MSKNQWFSRRTFLETAGLGAFSAVMAAGQTSDRNAAFGSPFTKRIAVDPLPDNLDWINVGRPLKLETLRGKFVLLDFWTLGCINCMHVIPELHKLEKAWPDVLVVIGVHSAKFAEEKNTATIRAAVRRYRIEHPVVNDAELAVWKSFGINVWPSLVLIDPEGYAVWGHRGEITFEALDLLLRRAVPFYQNNGTLDRNPMKFAPKASEARRQSPLLFPGKILADPSNDRLFIADSGNNRIVVARRDGKMIETIGSGEAGRRDGDFSAAAFNSPQGMALDGDALYVADTLNHSIRRIDFAGRNVTTVAGTGRQNRGTPPFARPAKPAATALSSPWDLCLHGAKLYIAMAGLHQIWIMDLARPGIMVFAGNGVEDIVDGRIGPRRPYQPGFAAFAQPSGLATDGLWLYVADSEGSSIRAVPFDGGRSVRTVVGTAHLPAARLFTYGDVDGPRETARLQHPLGVAFHEGKLFVADTYNDKIKTVDPATGETRSLPGPEQPGSKDDPPEFNKPGGIAAADGMLFIADTDNHLIHAMDLRDANRVRAIHLEPSESE